MLDERRCQVRLARKFPAPSTGLGKLRRNGGPCVRQNRVVLAVVATVKLLRMRPSRQPARRRRLSRERGRPERTRLPGEHGISRPTTAQGRPSDWLHLYAAVRFFLRVLFAQRTAGASRHPAFPAPSWPKRVKRRSKARANYAARMRRRVCDHTLAVLAREGGRSSIPEAVVMEPRSCGVLDSLPSRRMTTGKSDTAADQGQIRQRPGVQVRRRNLVLALRHLHGTSWHFVVHL
ncbi:hypothetical protein ACVJMY_007558 [Bradyrhizobium diazoefficiens]